MGTDIHAIFQRHTNMGWEDIESNYEGKRHYFLFSWLAGVRNNSSYEYIFPITGTRGLPDDFAVNDDMYIGDHSFSWLTSDEILNAKLPQTIHDGIISIKEYNEWDKTSEPQSYCAGMYGPNIKIAKSVNDIDKYTTHVVVHWKTPDNVFDYFLDEIRRLKQEYGNVRMVFGFDS